MTRTLIAKTLLILSIAFLGADCRATAQDANVIAVLIYRGYSFDEIARILRATPVERTDLRAHLERAQALQTFEIAALIAGPQTTVSEDAFAVVKDIAGVAHEIGIEGTSLLQDFVQGGWDEAKAVGQFFVGGVTDVAQYSVDAVRSLARGCGRFLDGWW